MLAGPPTITNSKVIYPKKTEISYFDTFNLTVHLRDQFNNSYGTLEHAYLNQTNTQQDPPITIQFDGDVSKAIAKGDVVLWKKKNVVPNYQGILADSFKLLASILD